MRVTSESSYDCNVSALLASLLGRLQQVCLLHCSERLLKESPIVEINRLFSTLVQRSAAILSDNCIT